MWGSYAKITNKLEHCKIRPTLPIDPVDFDSSNKLLKSVVGDAPKA